MSYTISRELSEAPSNTDMFKRMALSAVSRKKQKGELPKLKVRLPGLVAEPKKVKEYNKVCGYPVERAQLPVTYPHIMAFPLHMDLLTSEEFPYPLLGLVHVKNEISQHRVLNAGDRLDFTCELATQREVEKGKEFDVTTVAEINGEVVWESVSTFLYRSKSKSSGGKGAPEEQPPFNPESVERFKAPGDIGRKYARVSGDFNLIHIHPLTAKVFGFNRAIAHGMWAKAKSLAYLEKQFPEEPFKVEVKFKLPLMLPAEVMLQSKTVDNVLEFELKDKTGEKPHLAGSISKL